MVVARTQIQIRLAGPAAEQQWCEIVRATDWERATSHQQCEPDRKSAWDAAVAECNNDTGAARDLIAELRSDAEAEVVRSWGVVERLADGLADAGRLDRPAIIAILDA
jgi:hypothetical protein